MPDPVTRGYGLLERFLARRRAAVAESLIPEDARSGRLLDIGSGTTPHFLLSTRFAEKHGIDKVAEPAAGGLGDIQLTRHDFEHDPALPYPGHHFDVVTMLAVFEHIDPAILDPLLADIRRVLKPRGAFILTTPAGWADPLLRLLARVGLVSAVEIEEHKDRYDHAMIRERLLTAGFGGPAMEAGSFELGMNLWVRARR